MSTFESFLPDSRVGIPVHPFPPGAKWGSTQEMVEEILSDLKLPWVQDFILRSHPRQDVHALSDPSNYSRAMSGALDYKTIPHLSGGLVSHLQSVRLLLPVISIDSIGVGICVEDSKLQNSHKVLLLKSLQFSRFVCNNRTHSLLLVRFMEDIRKVTVSYTSFGDDGIWIYVNMHVDYTSFVNAFDKNTRAVDFQTIIRRITQTSVSGIPYRKRPALKGNHLYPNKAHGYIGDHFIRGIVCMHSNGQPVKSLSLFGNASYSWNYNAGELRQMQNWGITDRLQRLPAALIRNPKMSISGFLLNEDREPGTAISNNQTGPSSSNIHAQVSTPQGSRLTNINRAINIAPRPQYIFRPLKARDELEQKKELRKIRKREAAARAYQRKKLANTIGNSRDKT